MNAIPSAPRAATSANLRIILLPSYSNSYLAIENQLQLPSDHNLISRRTQLILVIGGITRREKLVAECSGNRLGISAKFGVSP